MATGRVVPRYSPPRLCPQSNPKPEDPKYKFTQFAKDLNTVPAGAPEPLPSDARRRPDRFALMVGDSVKAGEQKSVLEDRQRAEKRVRAAPGLYRAGGMNWEIHQISVDSVVCQIQRCK